MAEALISMLMERLEFLAQDKLKEVRLIIGVEKEVHSLSSNLQAIQAVLRDAQRRRVTEIAVRGWLDDLGDLSCDLDDVLDEWITLIDRGNFDKEEGYSSLIEEEEDNAGSILAKKVCFFILSFCFPRIQFHQVGMPRRHNIACKIKELNERLDTIAVEKRIYYFNSASVEEQLERPETSFVDTSQVYGRDKEKKILISKLLTESSHDGIGFDVIPVAGVGGIGKTTLAQFAYNDKKVKEHFEKTIWICVSEIFNEIRIANEILESLEGCAFNLVSMTSLLHQIRESIEGVKFLLVLDDVWIEDTTKWVPLKEAFKNGATGSKILVTTRKKEVVNMMRAETRMITIEHLDEEACWSMFSQLAFFGRDRCEQLEEIGKRIVVKSKGVPLVVKTLGSLLRFRKGRQQWEDVLHSKLWDIEDAKLKAFVPFLLSYNDLPSIEKCCLSYCSIFPKDFKIDKGDLIDTWMSQGYLGRNKNTNSEKLGQDCFENLAMRCFFQDFEKDFDGNVVRCKMHDIIHNFVRFLTKEKMDQTKEKTRHTTLLFDLEANIPRPIYEKESLRTLFVKSSKRLNDISCELYSSLTCLRTLNLSHNTIEKLPDGIDNLIHLRYLNLSHNPFLKELPESLCEFADLKNHSVS